MGSAIIFSLQFCLVLGCGEDIGGKFGWRGDRKGREEIGEEKTREDREEGREEGRNGECGIIRYRYHWLLNLATYVLTRMFTSNYNMNMDMILMKLWRKRKERFIIKRELCGSSLIDW